MPYPILLVSFPGAIPAAPPIRCSESLASLMSVHWRTQAFLSLIAMVLPGYLSRLGRDPLDSSHESGSAVGHGRANPGLRARTRNWAHSSQKQRSPGCVLTLRRPGFDTQLVLDRMVPNSPLPSGPAANLATIPDTRTGQALVYDGAFSPVPAHDCSDNHPGFPTWGERTLRSLLHLSDCSGRLQ